MNIFEKNIEVATAQLKIEKTRLKLFIYGVELGLGRENAEKIAAGSLFYANTNYRAKGDSEFTAIEASKIDAMLDQIDALESQIYKIRHAA